MKIETAGAFPPNPFGNVYQKYPKGFRSIHTMFTYRKFIPCGVFYDLFPSFWVATKFMAKLGSM